MVAANPSTAIGHRLDHLPLTRLHLGAVAVCTLAMACAIAEISLSGALSAIMSTGPGRASATELSVLLSSVYVGAIVGAPLFGHLADRVGRRTVLIAVLCWIAAMSVAAGFTRDVPQLALCRGLAGLALGALPPLVIAFLADLLPPHRRGPLTLWCIAFSTLGPTCTLLFLRAVSTAPAAGVEPWRVTFWVLAVACGGVAVLAALLPESPRFLAVVGRDAAATRALARYESSRVLRWEGGTAVDTVGTATSPRQDAGRVSTVLLYVLFALSPWATTAFPVLSGAVLTQRGFALNDALLVVGLSTLGPLLGNVVASMGVDRIDRRHGLIVSALVMLLAGTAFVSADQPWQAICSAAAYGMASSVYLSILNLYAAEFFPTAARGRHLSRAWALNRIGAAVAPMLLVPLLRQQGPVQMFVVIVAALVAGIVVAGVSPRGRERLALA